MINVEYIEEEQDVLVQTSVVESLWNALVEMISPKARIILAALVLGLFLASSPDTSSMCDKEPAAIELCTSTDIGQSQVRQRLESRLNDLQSREVPSESNVTISAEVANFAQKLINCVSEEDLEGWRLYPDAKGSLGWDYSDGICESSISMGNDGFSWYMKGKGELTMIDRPTLNLKLIENCLHKVHMI